LPKEHSFSEFGSDFGLTCRVKMHTIKAFRLHRPITLQCLRITPTPHHFFWRRKEIQFPELRYFGTVDIGRSPKK